MSSLLVGYARCSTDAQDTTAQRDALLSLGVEAERVYVDHGAGAHCLLLSLALLRLGWVIAQAPTAAQRPRRFRLSV